MLKLLYQNEVYGMICRKCKAQIELTDGLIEGKCKFCGRPFVVKTQEEERLDDLIDEKKLALKDFDVKLKKKREELDMLKKSISVAIQVIALFVVFLLCWHYGSERSFKRNPVLLVFVSILVVPGFCLGYLYGIVLAYKFAIQTGLAPQGAIMLAICTLNVSSVVMAIRYLFITPYRKVKKQLKEYEKQREEFGNELDELIKERKSLETK